MVANAEQWNFQHLTYNADPLLAPPLIKLIFLRGGTQWKMSIPFELSQTALDIQLSFRNNAATRGNANGTYPVIEFMGLFDAGSYTLELTLNTFGQVSMLMRFNLDGTNYSLYESEWVIVA